MHELPSARDLDKAELYTALETELVALLAGESDWIARLANSAALLFHSLPDVNWLGFYLLANDELIVGPFQGKPACIRIPLGKGVCGTAAAARATVLVPDVHEFPGHIACDAASNAEIVVPLEQAGTLLGVLDVDSPLPGRFDEVDRAGLERLAKVILGSGQG